MSFALPKNTGTEVNATTGTLTVPWPAHIAGDVGILFVTSSAGGTTQTLSTAAGFALIGTATTGTGTAGVKVSAYWCRASGSSQASPVVAAGTDYKQGVIQTFEDVIASGNPIDAFLTGVKAAASTTVDVPFPGTTEPRQTIIEVLAKDTDTSGNFLSTYNAYGHHFGTTRWFSNGTTSGTGGGMALLVSRGPASPVATGTALTVALQSASINAMISIALKGKVDSVAYQLYDGIDFTSSAANYVAQGTGITVQVTGSTISWLDWWRETTGTFTDPAEVRYTATGLTVGTAYTITGDFLGFAAAGTIQLGTVETGLGSVVSVPGGSVASLRVSHTFTATATTHVIRFIADNGAADTDMQLLEWWMSYIPGVTHTVTGTSTATASSSGAAVLVKVATGTSTATASSSGAALLVRVATGTSTATASSSGAAQLVAIATGTSTAHPTSTGAAALVTAVTGTSTASASSSGTAALVFTLTGSSTAVAASSGAVLAAAILTGTSTATAASSGVAVAVLITTGTSTAIASSSGEAVETGGPATGISTALASSSGVASLVIMTTGTSTAAASSSGVVVAVLLVTGTSTATASSSGVATVTLGDITVTGRLEPAEWTGELAAPSATGALEAQRWTGALEPATPYEGALLDPTWKGSLIWEP